MKHIFTKSCVCLLLLIFSNGVFYAESPKKVVARTVSYDIPSGYKQIGSTDIYCRKNSESFDIIGRFGTQYYSSTFSDKGYRLAMKVGSKYAVAVDCLDGTEVDGVKCQVDVVQQGDFAKVVYTLTNSNEYETIVSLGTYADVMIGNNDRAPISRRIDNLGNTYGLTMKDGNGAELCVLFGSGLVGVNAVSDFWFGYFSLNKEDFQIIGNYTSGDCYMQENGDYDSGMGWCWKERVIPSDCNIELSYLIGVGDVNLEPTSSFEVTPEDPEGWNDLSRAHRLTLEGEYESPAGQNGKIQYAVETDEIWLDLTEELKSGSNFSASLIAQFNPELPNHTIYFRTIDAVGNTAMLSPIVYKDVCYHEITGIEDKVYNWGDSIIQTSISCDLMSDQYKITNYRNNINSGVASFNIEGVFPYTIGRKTYSFHIEPLALKESIVFDNDVASVYNGNQITPDWHFTYDKQNELIENRDYEIIWKDNLYPGTAILLIRGINNFSGDLQTTFIIDKAQLKSDLFSFILPSEDLVFDDKPHPATYSKDNGVGDIIFYYSSATADDLSKDAPINIGQYEVYAEINEGELYYGLPIEKIGSFTIYAFDEADWSAIQEIVPLLIDKGWKNPWQISNGVSSVSSFEGLDIASGHIVGINLDGQGLSGTFPVELLLFNSLNSLNISNNNFYGNLEMILALAIDNPTRFAGIETLNIVGNKFSGNIGAFASAFPSLKSLNASDNHLSEVYPMISPNVTNLDLARQTIDNEMELDLSNMTVKTTPDNTSAKPFMLSQYNGGVTQYVYSLKVTKHFGGESGYVIKGARGSDLTDDYPPEVDMRACFGTIAESEYRDEELALFTFEDAGDGFYHIYCVNDSVTPVVRLATISTKYAGSVQRLTSSNLHLSDYNLWNIKEVGDGQIRILANNSSYGWDASGNIGTSSSYTRGDIMLYGGGDYFTPILEYTTSPAIQIPSILLYNHRKQSYNKPLRMKLSNDDGWNVVLVYNNGQIGFTDVSRQNAYHGESGDIVSVVAQSENATVDDAYLKVRLKFSQGDANFSGSVDILDLQSTINFMFGEYVDRPYNFTAANLWPDDMINVQDAVGIVNLLMNNESNTATFIKKRSMRGMSSNIADANILLSEGTLSIESSKPVAAFDITITGDAQPSAELYDMGFITNTKSHNGVTQIIGYSLSGLTLPSNTIICSLKNSSPEVIAAKLSDRDADEVTCKVSVTNSTGIENVKTDDLENYEVYTLDGIRVSNKNLQTGNVYIIKSENGIRKVIVSDKYVHHE